MNRSEISAIRKFQKAAESLNRALEVAKLCWPKAELYLAAGALNLMSGPHHEGSSATARPDRVLATATIPGIDGGDW